MTDEWIRGDYLISTDPTLIDVDLVHDFLTHSYWAEGIPIEVVKRSIENSLCFGIYKDKQEVGFARVISDLATYAYIGDVFVLESYRGLGLGVWLIFSTTKMARRRDRGRSPGSRPQDLAHADPLLDRVAQLLVERHRRRIGNQDLEVHLRSASAGQLPLDVSHQCRPDSAPPQVRAHGE